MANIIKMCYYKINKMGIKGRKNVYNYILNICIVSDNMYLQNELGKISPRERFNHTFKTVADLNGVQRDSDIFIVEDNADVLEYIYKIKKEDAQVVFYGEQPTSYSCFDEIWRKPLSKEGLIFSFNSLLDKIKLDKDYKLNKNYLETLIDNTPDLVWFKDIAGSHVKVNNSFCKAVNKTKKQVEGRGHYYIWDITPEDYSTGEYVCLESEDMVINAKKSMVFDEQVKTKDGMRKFVTTKSPIFNEYNEIMGTVGQAHDVTELNNVSREMNLFIENMPFGVIVSNEEDIILNTNTRMEVFTGWKREDIVGHKANIELNKITEVLEDTPEKKVAVLDTKFNGEYKTLEMTKIHITDVFKKPMGIMRIFRDITTVRKLEKQVAKSAYTDFLTGLYNRRYFYQYVNTECVGKPVSILTMDLDNFKGINDTYGHHIGDEALVLTADILRETFDNELIVRIGGDEFLVVLINNDLQNIEDRTKAVLNNLNAAFGARKEFSKTSASIGVAVTPSFSNDLDQILRKSDMALYDAKRNHKGSYCISK